MYIRNTVDDKKYNINGMHPWHIQIKQNKIKKTQNHSDVKYLKFNTFTFR